MVAGKRETLLVLGSMDEFVPLVEHAHMRGCCVIVADGYENGPARQLADEDVVVSVADTIALASLCREKRVDALVASYSDVLFEAGCRVAHAAGLETSCTLEAMEQLRNKEAMKAMFSQLDIPHARSCIVSAQEATAACEQLHFPCVFKPLDGYGSYGVTVVEAPEGVHVAAEAAARESSRESRAVIEEYNDGCEFNMITWVVDGEVQVVSIADREKTKDACESLPHVSRIVYPSRFAGEVIDEASEYAQRVATHLRLGNGPLCVQFFWSPKRGVEICEMTGRVFGYEHELLEYACGLSVEDLLLDTALDVDALREQLANHDALGMTRRSCGVYFHAHDGVVGDAAVARAALDRPLVKDALVYYRSGDEVCNGRSGKPYAARAFLQADSYADLDGVSAKLYEDFALPDAAGKNLVLSNKLPQYVQEKESSCLTV